MPQLGQCKQCSASLATVTEFAKDNAGNIITPMKQITRVKCSGCGNVAIDHPYQKEIDAQTLVQQKAGEERVLAQARAANIAAGQPEYQTLNPVLLMQQRLDGQGKLIAQLADRLAALEAETAAARKRKSA